MNFFQREVAETKTILRKVPPVWLNVFVLSVVCMNLLANKELFKTEWVALDCGFALSWIPFLFMDCVCKVYGGKAATRLSLFAILINLMVFAIFKLITLTPGMWGQYYSTGLIEVNNAVNATIGGSTWIVLGSAFAMFISSVVNSVLNISISRLSSKDNYGTFAARSFVSTAIAQYVDNFVFAIVVSIPLFGWTMRQTLICALTAATFELLMEICFSGVGYRLSKKW